MTLLAVLASSLLTAGPSVAAPSGPPSKTTASPPTGAAVSTPSPSPSSPSGACARLVASEAWVRLLPAGTANTAAFFRLQNTGATDAVVVGAASPIARRAGVHGMTKKDGVMRMFDVERVVVPAGGEVAFRPGGLHVMLFEQTAPHAGDAVPITLRCDDASTATITATAAAAAPTTPSTPAQAPAPPAPVKAP